MSEFEPPDEVARDAVKKARGEEGRGAPQAPLVDEDSLGRTVETLKQLRADLAEACSGKVDAAVGLPALHIRECFARGMAEVGQTVVIASELSSLRAHSSALESENASLKLEVQSLIELREAHYKQILDLRSKVAELEAKLVEATKVKAALPFRWRCIECESGSGVFPTEAEAEMAGQEHASTCPARLKLIDQIAAYRLVVADLSRKDGET